MGQLRGDGPDSAHLPAVPSPGIPTVQTGVLSSKYQISIPKAIRAAQHWEAGVTFGFIPKGTGVLLVPVPRLQTLKGMARGASPEGCCDRSDQV